MFSGLENLRNQNIRYISDLTSRGRGHPLSLPSLNGAKNIPHHGALVYESRQVTGPGLYGTPVTGTLRSNPVTDQAGDAQWSHYSLTGTRSDQRQLDLLSLQLTQRDSAHLTVLDSTPPCHG